MTKSTTIRFAAACAFFVGTFSLVSSASAGDFYEKYNGHRNVKSNQIYNGPHPASFSGLIDKDTCKTLAKASDAKRMCDNGNDFKLIQANGSCTKTIFKGTGTDGNFLMVRYAEFAAGKVKLCTGSVIKL